MRDDRTTRRTLIRTTAWAAPIVTVVAAAPAHAASVGSLEFGGGSVMTMGRLGRSSTLEVFVTVKPAPGATPVPTYSVRSSIPKAFSSVNPRPDWGPGVYQCSDYDIAGDWSTPGQTVVTVWVPGHGSVDGSVEIYGDEPF